MMDKLIFGTAGIPLSTKQPSTINGIAHVKELNLDAMELEFVHSINISEKSAPSVRSQAESSKIILTCHAPYFINLNSKEETKLSASRQRIIQSAKIANLCGCYSVIFHAGFYQGIEKEKVYNNIKENLKIILTELKNNDIKITLRPELTGKPSQFGDISELIRLSSELENVLPCIDFAHYHARDNGKYNTYEDFSNVLAEIEKSLGRQALNNIHIHIAGINYTIKGERNHLNLRDSDMNYNDLIKSFKEFKIKGVVISESPNIEQDAIFLKKLFNK